MGLDCLPRTCSVLGHGHRAKAEGGVAHEMGAMCPFLNDRFPLGILGTCCSLRGKVAAYELHALGEEELASEMHRDMNCSEARDFVVRLRVAANRLEQRYADTDERPPGFKPEFVRQEDGSMRRVSRNGPTFERAIECIRQAARWYEKVAELGLGVHAWS